jgi:high-affinity iron transporter
MAKNVFSLPIFIIILRETIEAGIIVSILLSFVEQLVNAGGDSATTTESSALEKTDGEEHLTKKQLLSKLRKQIWLGAGVGFFIALAIGAAFIGVFYSQALRDLWAQSEEIWEGVFSLIAAIIIFMTAIAFLKLEQSKVKWRIKLAEAFQRTVGRRSKSKYALFLLPFITVLREGLEAVVFVGGVSLGQPATSIPLAVICGLLVGIIISYIIYRGGSALAIHWFLIVSTCILLLVGAGLFSRSVGDFQRYAFNKGVGADVAELGNGPGSFDVDGNIWHLTYGNPELKDNSGWSIFNAILGWDNNATLGTILSYVFYWIAVIATLVFLKWKEGRSSFLGFRSKAYYERQQHQHPRQGTGGSDSDSAKEHDVVA